MFLSYEQAVKAAAKLAREKNDFVYIWYEPNEGLPEFEIGRDYEADTYFCGLEPMQEIGPDGLPA